jgi:hypothetical protein
MPPRNKVGLCSLFLSIIELFPLNCVKKIPQSKHTSYILIFFIKNYTPYIKKPRDNRVRASSKTALKYVDIQKAAFLGMDGDAEQAW